MTRCTACGNECQEIEVDFGIGAYEYWGATGVDIQLAWVSDCCEADCVHHDGPLEEPVDEEEVAPEGTDNQERQVQ